MVLELAGLETLRLESGGHEKRTDGVCVMEAVAWFAGEPHSDHPECASKLLTTFAMGLNDSWDADQRQKLVPFIPRLLGTRDGRDHERGLLAADWLLRTYTPAWLRLANLTDEAEALAGHAPLTDWSGLADFMADLEAARAKAAAARTAARDAAWDAAWTAAARAAARDAAWDAARDAAWAAAWTAAWAAAGAAARDAAGAALKPTVTDLQASALELLDRMILDD